MRGLSPSTSDARFLSKKIILTPYLDEVKRIIKSCPNKKFKQPEVYGSKLEDIKYLLRMGSNIVSTHALFLKFDNEIMDLIQLQGYILILDEVVEVARQMDEIKGKGYTKSYLACNARATNAYIDRTAIAYMCNRYFNPILKNFFIMQGVRVEEEAWALSELLQFLFRSAIREGNKITVYIPSSRMRRLLENWMNKGPIYSIDK